MNIYLIGYRCTGKTTVGNTVAAKLGWPYVDTDELVMEYAGCSIKDIVEDYEWEGFRRLEKHVLVQIVHRDRYVVATGGGIVLDESNVDLMKKRGTIIWLAAKPGTIASRMTMDPKTDDMRPALTHHGVLKEISQELEIREPLYLKASDFHLPTDHQDIDALSMVIIRLIRERADIRPFCSETISQLQFHIQNDH